MNLTVVDGLWTLTAEPTDLGSEPYEQVVVELAGAVAAWPLDAASGSWPVLTLTDVDEADWLWRWIGAEAHIAVHTAIAAGQPGPVDASVDVDEVAQVQRLGHGHWLRQWWPTSPAGDIPALDPVLLALEVAVLTARCDAVLGDGWDSQPDLLAAVSAAEMARVVADVPAARPLIDELDDEWVPHWSQAELDAVRAGSATSTTRGDYALAAGGATDLSSAGVAHGRASIDWAAVPAGIFDAAEGSLHWSVNITQTVRVSLTTQLLPGADPTGLSVSVAVHPRELTGTPVEAVGRLDRHGRAELELPLAPTVAWTLPWDELLVTVGPSRGDHRQARARVRAFVTARLAGGATFLAEEHAAANDW